MTISALNALPVNELKTLLHNCCGSAAWVEKMTVRFPVENLEFLLDSATICWHACTQTDWLEAFTHHPKIGDLSAAREKFAATADWAANEQSAVKESPALLITRLAEKNLLYEHTFGYIFIVFATGKSVREMLDILGQRLSNTPEKEIKIAMEEQNKITRLRLTKLLAS